MIESGKSKILSNQELEKFLNKLTTGNAFNIKNGNIKRDFDVRTTTIGEIADVLYTLISELQSKGIIQK